MRVVMTVSAFEVRMRMRMMMVRGRLVGMGMPVLVGRMVFRLALVRILMDAFWFFVVTFFVARAASIEGAAGRGERAGCEEKRA